MPIHLRVKADDYDRIYAIAKARRETVPDVVRRGLKRELDHPSR